MVNSRNFDERLGTFVETIHGYDFYVNFGKVSGNVGKIKDELRIMNDLVGSNDIRGNFLALVERHPRIRKCIPILIAVHYPRFRVMDSEGTLDFDFDSDRNSPEELADLMEKTGLFEMMQNRLSNLVDYVYGVETGLDSHGRKNRGGHRMEELVESYIKKTGCVFHKEMDVSEIENKFGLDLSGVSNDSSAEKRFDFVVESKNQIYALEVNFYSRNGSKLNETARSYKMLAEETRNIDGFTFVWITDGSGWINARNNLRETFDVLDTIYCINDLRNGVLEKLFKDKEPIDSFS